MTLLSFELRPHAFGRQTGLLRALLAEKEDLRLRYRSDNERWGEFR